MVLKPRAFGKSGRQVSELGYGMWGLAGWTGSDDDEVGQALQRAVDSGCTFFDTAWAYGDGASERVLGELVRANPDKELALATRVPPKSPKLASLRAHRWDRTSTEWSQ